MRMDKELMTFRLILSNLAPSMNVQSRDGGMIKSNIILNTLT
jgi:hypothetical protein